MFSTPIYADIKNGIVRLGAKSRIGLQRRLGTATDADVVYASAAAFLVLSGLASLTYQVVWVRLLGLSMGSTSASISTVLAAFFIGMAAGSFLAEHIGRNRLDSLRTYVALEALIGLSGLALLPLLLGLDQFMAWLPTGGSSLALKFAIAVTLLCVPTVCMGATFPVMASILVRHHQQVGFRISQLYALNTAGAVLGAALSGFVFIPLFGLDGAVFIAAGLNALIVAGALYVTSRFNMPPIVAEANSTIAVQTPAFADQKRALAILMVTGFTAIATQVGWTKYLAIFTGTTIYGFAAILTVFLFGIASGSWAVRRVIDRITDIRLWLILGLLALGTSLLLTKAGLTLVPNLYGAVNHLNFGAPVVFSVKYAVVFSLIFIPTFLFGALFPLNLKLYCGGISGLRARVGRAYAVNTLASIAGAILAGFWIIPNFGTDTLLTSMGLLTIASVLVFLPALPSALSRASVAAVTASCAAVALALPSVDYSDLIASVQYRYDVDALQGKEPDIVFLQEGKAGVVSVITYDKEIYKLQNNGLNESLLDPHDPDNALLAETLLGLIPYFVQDDPKSSFIVGFGGGITARALTLTDVESIRVVELEPAVIEAGRALYRDEIPALKDPRVSLTINDARNTLLVEDQMYDIIVAQPSHPWLARASNVFTQQFWQIVSSKLNDQGVFGQWVNLFNMNRLTLKSIFKGFYSVFPYGLSFVSLDTGDLLLFGAKQPIRLDYDKLSRHIEDPRVHNVLSKYDIHTPDDLLWYVALSRSEALAAAGDVEPNTDTNILSEVRLSALIDQPEGNESPYRFLENSFTMDLAPFFGEDAKERFYDIARYGLDWDNDFVVEKASSRLEQYDPDLARAIEYETLHRKFKYQAASELYAQHREWHPRVHLLEALALIDLGRQDEALRLIERISDNEQRQGARARVLYELGEWDVLARLEPHGTEERRWQLAAMVRRDPLAAGREIAAIVDEYTDDIPLLRAMVQHYSAAGNAGQMEHWARHLVRAIEKRTASLVTLAREAIGENDLASASLILAKLEHLNPDAKELTSLRNRLIQKSVMSVAQMENRAIE